MCKNLESTSTFYGAKAVAVMRQSRGLWCTEDYENGIGKQTTTEDSILFSKRWSFKNCGMFKSWNGLYLMMILMWHLRDEVILLKNAVL